MSRTQRSWLLKMLINMVFHNCISFAVASGAVKMQATVILSILAPRGEIYGALQHGALDLRIASVTDAKLVHQASKLVDNFLKKGYDLLEYKELAASVRKYQRLTTLN